MSARRIIAGCFLVVLGIVVLCSTAGFLVFMDAHVGTKGNHVIALVYLVVAYLGCFKIPWGLLDLALKVFAGRL